MTWQHSPVQSAGLRVGVLTAQSGPAYEAQISVLKQGVWMFPKAGKGSSVSIPEASSAFSLVLSPETFDLNCSGCEQCLRGADPLDLTALLPLSLHVLPK